MRPGRRRRRRRQWRRRDGGSGGVSCGPEAIRRQCSVAIDPGDAALQACKVGMQVSSWLLPPSPAPGKDIAKRLRDTLLLSRWVLERVGPRRESWGWDRSCTSAPVGIARLRLAVVGIRIRIHIRPPNPPQCMLASHLGPFLAAPGTPPHPPQKGSRIRQFGNSGIRRFGPRLLSDLVSRGLNLTYFRAAPPPTHTPNACWHQIGPFRAAPGTPHPHPNACWHQIGPFRAAPGSGTPPTHTPQCMLASDRSGPSEQHPGPPPTPPMHAGIR